MKIKRAVRQFYDTMPLSASVEVLRKALVQKEWPTQIARMNITCDLNLAHPNATLNRRNYDVFFEDERQLNDNPQQVIINHIMPLDAD